MAQDIAENRDQHQQESLFYNYPNKYSEIALSYNNFEEDESTVYDENDIAKIVMDIFAILTEAHQY